MFNCLCTYITCYEATLAIAYYFPFSLSFFLSFSLSLSIDDDNDRKVDTSSPPMMTDAVKQSSSPTRRESADQVTDLPVHSFKKLPITQMSDADSAIGLVRRKRGRERERERERGI